MIGKVDSSHPGRVAGGVAGALVGCACELDVSSRVAVGVLVGHGVCRVVAGWGLF